MEFKELLAKAQSGSHDAQELILERYKPLLMKESIVGGVFDEDLYQESCLTLIKCIHKFHINYNGEGVRQRPKRSEH